MTEVLQNPNKKIKRRKRRNKKKKNKKEVESLKNYGQIDMKNNSHEDKEEYFFFSLLNE
jgi:hypothetical protein